MLGVVKVVRVAINDKSFARVIEAVDVILHVEDGNGKLILRPMGANYVVTIEVPRELVKDVKEKLRIRKESWVIDLEDFSVY